MNYLNPPQKIKEHYLWTQLRQLFFFFVRFFCIFAFLGFCCVRFFWGSFFERNEKKQKKTKLKTKQQKTKKEEGPQDVNKKTT